MPVLEAGLGITGLMLPDYHGSDQSHGYVLPFPLIIYRGDMFKMDDDGMRGKLFDSEHLALDFSLGAGLPVNAKQNEARKGMESLDPTLEIGPELKAVFGPKDARLTIGLPVRTVFSSNFKSIEHRGLVSAPHVTLSRTFGTSERDRVGMTILAGPLFADATYHDYFYGVEEDDVTEDRPEYQSPGGYAGVKFQIAGKWRYGDQWVGGFARFEDLRGAVFEDSPLVRTRRYMAYGLAWVWLQSPS